MTDNLNSISISSSTSITPFSSSLISKPLKYSRIKKLYNKWNSALIKFSNYLLHFLLLRPMLSIFLPCFIFLILAYPSIIKFYISPNNINHNLYYSSVLNLSNSKFIKAVNFSNSGSNNIEDPEIILKIFSIEYINPINNGTNLLNKEFLIQFHDIQSILFNNTLSPETIVYSPLAYWNNDVSRIKQDNNILKTIQLHPASKKPLYQSLNEIQVLSGIKKSDGLIRSANSLRIISYYPSYLQLENTFNTNLKSVSLKYPDLAVKTLPPSSTTLNITSSSCSCLELFYIYVIFPLLIIQSLIDIKNSTFIKSRLGLLIALIIKFNLTTLTSLSFISLLFKPEKYLEIFQLPYPILISIPFSLEIINITTILSLCSKNISELSFVSRIAKVLTKSFPFTTNFTVSVLLILTLVPFFTTSVSSKIYCLFSFSCIICNFILTYTYFFTILIVDLNNVELEDLIQQPSNDANFSISEEAALSHNHRIDKKDKDHIQLTVDFIKSMQIKFKSKFPIFNYFSLILVVPIVFQWTDGISFSSLNKDIRQLLDVFLNKRGFAYELLKLIKSTNNGSISLQISSPILLSNYKYPNPIHLNTISSSFDMLYVFEFVSFLIFAVSLLIVILKLTLDTKSFDFSSISNSINGRTLNQLNPSLLSHTVPSFNSKDLVNGHVLDIVKVCTSQCPFIVSVGIDHKILVWSPLTTPIPAPTQLPIAPKFSPVTHVEMSDFGSLITVFSRSGEIKCWSRYSMSWVWTIFLDELVNESPLVSFFRKRTHVSTGRRKLVSRSSKRLGSSARSSLSPAKGGSKLPAAIASSTLPETPSPLSVQQPTVDHNVESVLATSKLHKDSETHSHSHHQHNHNHNHHLHHERRVSMDSNFDHTPSLKQSTDMEFIIVLKNGSIVTVDCVTGNIGKAILSNSPILCAKKLISPRVNDRIVGVKENGELVVSTVVNNNWKSRPVKVDTTSYNKGKSLITPAVLMKYQEFNYQSPMLSPTVSSSSLSLHEGFLGSIPSMQGDTENKTHLDKKVEFGDSLEGIVMEPVPFVGMIVRAFGSKCQLIDVQTGISLKEWQISKFKSNSFRVFHSEPSHCRFCGCVSFESFSIAYTELESDSLIMHTFSIDNRAKNNICLRVERDSRETRCLGFASVTEHQHVLTNVEEWCSTDMNILMGIRKKENREELIESDNTDEIRDRDVYGSELRNRSKGDEKKKRKNTDGMDEDLMKLSNIWEGWTMSVDGQVRFYEIPDGSDSGLLIKKLGPVRKFGHKSIVVSFGNIMKVLYLGNDNLIEEGEVPNDEISSPPSSSSSSKSPSHATPSTRLSSSTASNQRAADSQPSSTPMYNHSSSSLSFINRRRKLRMKKYDLTHSTNFEDATPESVSNTEDNEANTATQ